MKKTPMRLAALTCLTLALASAGQAFAHRDGDGRGRMTPPTAAQVSERLASAKGALKITAAQEGAWKQYEDMVRGQAAAREKQHAEMAERRKAGTPPDATEREALRKQFDAQRSARDKARDTLMAALTPEQKTVAERQLRRGDGGRGHGHHGHHGRRGDGHERGHGGRHDDPRGPRDGQPPKAPGTN
ncbi:Spy/CpxP family protein refolding chaperone [Aquabacterium sp. OR-4]|uniref:Spy/CpxP family protein refolding chaperone n=1 Tax=Aquabacterium sp. OR-4 TaxID=2978127 RepID=UPI0021B46729|nr:Spy/CpxP family protein refolding chaperone [Aquabacterium sp. OR-4]MDT7837542.1 Spy/CpxP family protein refolding chaperone [Aquabacterium sp. OR-4]